jgi:hypothetical protein
VKDIEEGAPRRTRKPEFLVFVPGYGSFPQGYTAPKGFLAELFEGPGTTIELPRLSNRQQRLNILKSASPHKFSDNPDQEIPRLTRAIERERAALGLDPPASERRK